MLSPTTLLFAILALIAVVATAWVVWPLQRHERDAERSAATGADRQRVANEAVVRERRAQLDRELAALPPDSPERERLILAFSTTALADLAPTASSARGTGRTTRWVGAAAMVLLLLGGPPAFYRLAGVPGIVDPEFMQALAPTTVEDLLAELERRLAADPKSAEGWMLLGRTRLSLGELPASVAALERALALDSPDAQLAAQIRVDLADALAQTNQSRLAGRPWTLIEEALQREPTHPKALALAGAYRVSQNDPAGALRYWRPLLAQLPPESDQRRQIAGFVADLEAGRPPGQTAAPDNGAVAGPTLRGSVMLDPALVARTRPDETIFIVVRSADENGTPVGPPAAAARIRVADLPWQFAFTDRDAMGPMTRLSAQQRVVVVARVSRKGEATPAAGDLEGQSAVVSPDADGVQVRIERERP